MTNTIIVTGPKGQWSDCKTRYIMSASQPTDTIIDSVPVRLELRDLSQDQLDLYLLGLARLQCKDESDDESYYQIAGIHGQPYKPWNGVSSTITRDIDWIEEKQFGGYCTHSSILFLTWHRPYMALFEVRLTAISENNVQAS